MPNFATLLQKPAGEAERPLPLPAGEYPGVIKSYELGESSQKKTPFVRFHLGITGWPEGAEPELKKDGTPVDLSTRQPRRDFFLTDDAMWRLDTFLRDLGIDLTGKSYADALPETQGSAVTIDLVQEMNSDTNDLFNSVRSLKKG